MLIQDPRVLEADPILTMVAAMNGNGGVGCELQPGIYEVGHFGSSSWLGEYDEYPEGLPVGSYGVCDSADNLLEKCPELVTSERQFVVTLTPVLKANQSPQGGWRWHKWGEYIGAHQPTCEYLYDEPHIERVYCYHIRESVKVPRGRALI